MVLIGCKHRQRCKRKEKRYTKQEFDGTKKGIIVRDSQQEDNYKLRRLQRILKVFFLLLLLVI
jgi:hypothetical protein